MFEFLKIRKKRNLTISTDLEILSMLDILESGVTDNGKTPFIKLGCGTILFGVLPNKKERQLYELNRRLLPATITENTFRVGLDVAQRYVRGNRWIPFMPKTLHLEVGYDMIDAGAYIGFGALAASRKVGEAGRIFAVEPVPENFDLMERNIVENNISNIEAIQSCIGSDVCNDKFYLTDRQSNSIHQELAKGKERKIVKRNNQIDVKYITIDSLSDSHRLIDNSSPLLVSLEINGAENEALEGAKKLMSEKACFEMHIPIIYYSGSKGYEENKRNILGILSEIPDIRIHEHFPFLFVRKGRYGSTLS